MVTIKEQKFKIIKNFLTKEEIELGKKYILIKHRLNITEFDYEQNNNIDTGFYRDPFFEALLLNKKDIMEKETNLKLLPTYSFCRVYTYASELERHKDRPSCEISVTVMLGGDGTEWPLYMDDTIPLNLEPGDAVIYLGCDLYHYRKPFTGDWHAQAFLHYVDKDGPNVEYVHDKKQPLYYLD